MHTEVKTEIKKYITITFNEEEYQLFRDGIGNTSEYGREEAGMSPKQTLFFTDLFAKLPSTPLF